MMNKELQYLEKKIRALPDAELLNMVSDSNSYRAEAITFAKEELKERNLETGGEKIKGVERTSIGKQQKNTINSFNLFSTTPNSIEFGGWMLILLGGINLIWGLWNISSNGSIGYVVLAVLLFILGYFARKRVSIFLYIGTALWLIDFLLFFVVTAIATGGRGYYTGAMAFKLWIGWQLIKSTPAYSNSQKKGMT